jgi:hypothetical protein
VILSASHSPYRESWLLGLLHHAREMDVKLASTRNKKLTKRKAVLKKTLKARFQCRVVVL